MIRRGSALVLAAAVVALSATGAAADASWVSASRDPLLDLTDVQPGRSGSATFTVTNPQSAPVIFSMRVVDLADDDNGCVEPEAASGDTTCGRGDGELQFDLVLSLRGDTGEIASRALVDWGTASATDPAVLGAREARTYTLAYELPLWSSNVTQSDLVSFALEMRLEQVAGDSVAVEPPVAVIGATKQLPRTGVDVRTVTVAALVIGLIGVTVYRRASGRRRPT